MKNNSFKSNNAAKAATDNRANQLNPIHPAFNSSRGIANNNSSPLKNTTTVSGKNKK